MAAEVIKLFPVLDMPHCLREMADAIEAGEINAKYCTVLIGGEVYHMGTLSDEQATLEAIFSMTAGVQRVLACRDSAGEDA